MLFVFSFIFCQLASLIGMLFTNSSLNSWYSTLNKPSFNPPSYVFGPVWVFLFLLMAIAFYLVLIKGQKNKHYKTAVVIFVLQWILNVLWSFFFFFMQSPFMALLEIMTLWLLILLTMYHFYKIEKVAAWFLAPYVLWVTFATILNFAIVVLN
ncbi:MAG TPA: tryptophan-rich sensory protein [bacterium]|nr:tryptophan-rich sensory protein [bacterium]